MIIFSGMPPGLSGVGRLMTCLQEQASERADGSARLYWRPEGQSPSRHLRRGQWLKALRQAKKQRQWQGLLSDSAVMAADPAILIHPQSLGYAWCDQLIRKRTAPTWMYVMDSSFFCIRSYNHIAGETSSCTRCLGGDWSQIEKMQCAPFPVADADAVPFVQNLQRWIAERRVRCLVQNPQQAELLRRHCGPEAVIRVVGLWTADMEIARGVSEQPAGPAYDVVFHGGVHHAKGFDWALEMARRCPELTFLFPCRRGKASSLDPPPNAVFKKMTWETGLGQQVQSAKLVLNPSLWSATIEGALVKSIFAARAVAVQDEPTAWSSGWPDGLILRLPPHDLAQAADALRLAVVSGWAPAAGLKTEWVREFQQANARLLERLEAACNDADENSPVQSAHHDSPNTACGEAA